MRARVYGGEEPSSTLSWTATFEGRHEFHDYDSIKALLRAADLMLRVFADVDHTPFQWGTIIVRGQGISGLSRIGAVEDAI